MKKSAWRRADLRFAAGLLGLVLLAGSACGVKKTVKVEVPPGILKARTASFQELVSLINDDFGKIQSLSSTTLRATLRSGKIESGKLQEYRSAPGYVLLKRPDMIRLSIQNPLTKTSVADLASVGDDFSLWLPRDNRFFIGKNSLKDLEVEGEEAAPTFTARPLHIFQALLPPGLVLGQPGFHVAMEEEQSQTARYYVMSLYKDDGDSRLLPVRKYWVDRAELAVVRQQTYEADGEIASIIRYSNLTRTDGTVLPLSVLIERPIDGYSLDMEFKSWRLNPQLPEDAFVLAPPPGAQRIRLVEKRPNQP